jgi:dimeric dUTPase (all-alpha-NTP-PPase superfamily)
MKLSELLAIQAELNQHCKGQPKSEEDVLWAIVAELGESANARKGEWGWWEKYGKPLESESRDRQLDEWADVLCFLLTQALFEKAIPVENGWDHSWASGAKATLSQMLWSICGNDYSGGVFPRFAQFLSGLGYTREEIEGAYLKKVAVNKERWALASVKDDHDRAILAGGRITPGLGDK